MPCNEAFLSLTWIGANTQEYQTATPGESFNQGLALLFHACPFTTGISSLSAFGLSDFCGAGLEEKPVNSTREASGLISKPNPGLSRTDTSKYPLVGIGSLVKRFPNTGSTDLPSGELARYSWNGEFACDTTKWYEYGPLA